MDFNKIPSVTILVPNRDCKFILAQVSDTQISDDKDQKLVIRAAKGRYLSGHPLIVYYLKREAAGLRINCLGGGILHLSPDNKTIEFGGRSFWFGRPDYEKVKQLLQLAYPDFKIIINHRWRVYL